MLRPAALLLLIAPALGQNPAPVERIQFVTAHHGPLGGFGELGVYEDRHGAALAFPDWGRDLRFLPLDFVGRTELRALAPDVPRRRADLPGGASRLVLQGGMGTLLRFERLVGGGRRFGFLHLAPDGRPRIVLERPGVGAGEATDPFVARIAVDPGGKGFLAATTAAAGGDLLEVHIGTGAVTDRTPHVGPLDVSDAGLGLGVDWGWAVAAGEVLRFARGPGAIGQPVPMPGPTPTWYSGQAVASPERSFAATTAGSGPTLQHVWVFGPSGPARLATQAPANLSGAGHQPEADHGPYLAVSDDGRMAAWRTEGTTRECFLTRLDLAQPPVQVTANGLFVDTVDEVGQINLAAGPDVLSMAAGELNTADGTYEKVDYFEVRLDAAGNPLVENRSLTSGDATPPFVAGTLSPELVRLVPGDGRLLIYDENDDRVLELAPGQVGTKLLMNDVKEVYFVEPAGDRLLVGLRRSFNNKPGQLFTAKLDLTGWQQLPAGGDDVEFRSAVGHSTGMALVETWVADTQELLLRVDATTGSVDAWQPTASSYPGPCGFTALGAALFAQGPPAGPVSLRVWPANAPAFDLAAPAGPGIVLR